VGAGVVSPGVRKPTTEQQRFVGKSIAGAADQTLRRAQQIVRERSFTYERVPVVCVRCGGPREPWAHPICDNCR
jgi:hypothetical protein